MVQQHALNPPSPAHLKLPQVLHLRSLDLISNRKCVRGVESKIASFPPPICEKMMGSIERFQVCPGVPLTSSFVARDVIEQ